MAITNTGITIAIANTSPTESDEDDVLAFETKDWVGEDVGGGEDVELDEDIELDEVIGEVVGEDVVDEVLDCLGS